MPRADRSPNARRRPSSQTIKIISPVGPALPRRPLFPSNAPRLMKTKTPVANQPDSHGLIFEIFAPFPLSRFPAFRFFSGRRPPLMICQEFKRTVSCA
jgi:hypothetical protein